MDSKPSASALLAGSVEAALSSPVKVWGHKDRLFCAAFSPCSTALATASADGTARVWDVSLEGAASAKSRHVLRGDTGELLRLAWHPVAESAVLVTGGTDGLACVWNTADGSRITSVLTRENEQVYALAFSSGGDGLLMGFDDELRLVDFSTAQPLGSWTYSTLEDGKERKPHGGEARNPENKVFVFDVAVRPNDGSNVVAVGLADGTTRVRDLRVAGGGDIAVLLGHESFVSGCAFSSDGTALASASGDSTVVVWDARKWKGRASLGGHSKAVFGVAFWPQSTMLLSWGSDCSLLGWLPESCERAAMAAGFPAFPLYSVAVSPNGNSIALCGGGSSVMGLTAFNLARVAAPPQVAETRDPGASTWSVT